MASPSVYSIYLSTRLLDQNQLDIAADIIRAGGIVVFPTETVYGLGGDAESEAATTAIYRAKGRPPDNPLIVHVADREGAARVAASIPEGAEALMDAFWPGPLTIVLPKGLRVAGPVTAGLDTVAVRCPDHYLARTLIEAAGTPIAAPSANRSGRPSPTTFNMAVSEMNGRVDAIIDGGDCVRGLESTVVRIAEDGVHILRPGSVTAEMLDAVLGDEKRTTTEYASPRSPGTRHAHYQPRAPVYVAEHIHVPTLSERLPGRIIGVLCVDCSGSEGPRMVVRKMSDLEDYARRLYREFASLDEAGCDVIVAELPQERGVGAALRDRLLRASAGRMISGSTG